ncbi:unnamed protein product [Clonostachys solani]|uniref:CCHC-type domain-containing protein n=1 Tax=Clonostachys solani TaxID=160281 RepID=A0A9N9ZQ84_9HYPO|nr:unnamed protein product [Clonostachys solani]
MTNGQDRQDMFHSIKVFVRLYKERRRGRLRCFNCNKRGHKKAQCPMPKNNTGQLALSTTPLHSTPKAELDDTKAELVVVKAEPTT